MQSISLWKKPPLFHRKKMLSYKKNYDKRFHCYKLKTINTILQLITTFICWTFDMALFQLVAVTISSVILLPTFVLPYVLSPDFISSPTSITVTYGDTATFTCSIPSSLNRDVYWGRKNTSSVVYDFISMEETITNENFDCNKFNVTRTETPSNRIYTMRIMSVTSADSANYFCAMLVPYNNTNYYEMSSYALLAVMEPELPSLECFTTPKIANVGDEVTFSCRFNKSQNLNLALTWNRNRNRTQVAGDTDVDSTFGGTGRVLPGQEFNVTWKMKESDNYENFECYVVEKRVCVTTPLQVDPSPIVLQDQDNPSSGGNASFYCKTTINYPPVIRYFWNVTSGSSGTYLLNSTTDRFHIVDEGKAIVITNLTELDNGSKVSCVVITSTGMSYTSPVLNINVLHSRQDPDYPEFNSLLIIVVSLPIGTLLIILVLGCVIQQKCKMPDWTATRIKALDVRQTRTQKTPAAEGQSSQLGRPEQAIPMVEQQVEGVKNSGTDGKRYSEPKYAIPAPANTASSKCGTDILATPRYANTSRDTMERGLSEYTDEAGYVHASPILEPRSMDVSSDSNNDSKV